MRPASTKKIPIGRRDFLAASVGVLGARGLAQSPDAASRPGFLEREPEGWIDISPNPALEGWAEFPWFDQKGDDWRRAGQWHMDERTGVLLCDGAANAHTMLLHERELQDFVFHVEWRFTNGPSRGGHNSGVLVRMLEETAERKVMHQVETRAQHAGWLRGGGLDHGLVTVLDTRVLSSGGWIRVDPGYPRGWRKHVTRVEPASNPQGLASAYDVAIQAPLHPPGEWNSYEIECVGSRISVWTNGVPSCVAENCRVPRGRVGLEAEWHSIEFRRLRVKERALAVSGH